MRARVEGNIAILAGLVVLLSARVHLAFAAAVALLVLAAFSAYLLSQVHRP